MMHTGHNRPRTFIVTWDTATNTELKLITTATFSNEEACRAWLMVNFKHLEYRSHRPWTIEQDAAGWQKRRPVPPHNVSPALKPTELFKPRLVTMPKKLLFTGV